MKVAGRRSSYNKIGFTKEKEEFLKLCAEFRDKDVFFHPRGVFKFKTFEEENEWTLKMLLRKKKKADRRQQKT